VLRIARVSASDEAGVQGSVYQRQMVCPNRACPLGKSGAVQHTEVFSPMLPTMTSPSDG